MSSHNIEHLPNPIRFLQLASRALKPGGTLRLAVPDKRACFDHFRSLSDTSQWLEAFHQNRVRPTAYQRFQVESMSIVLLGCGEQRSAWRLGDVTSSELQSVNKAQSLFSTLFCSNGVTSSGYVDTHCWAFTPESFELIIRDLIAFGLVSLHIECVSQTVGHEFFVDLRRPLGSSELPEPEYLAKRLQLLRCCTETDRAAVASWKTAPCRVVRTLAQRVSRFTQGPRSA